MNLSTHLKQYRTSLAKDALDRCIEYSKATPTAQPDQFPSVYDYLKLSLGSAIKAAECGDYGAYSSWLQRHQAAMVALFERMVEEYLDSPLEAGKLTERRDHILRMVTRMGWEWFKFSKSVLDVTYKFEGVGHQLVTMVPRYSADLFDKWNDNSRPIFDADEMRLLSDMKSFPHASKALGWKKDNAGFKIVGTAEEDESVFLYKPKSAVNREEVLDWTLQLFF